MMLQILKKQNFNLFKKLFIAKSLVVVFATGLFALNDKPVDGLNDDEYDKFMLGKSFFAVPWVEAPSVTTARDGLGPLFNANSCIACHPSNAQGKLFNKDGFVSRSLIAKLSIKSND